MNKGILYAYQLISTFVISTTILPMLPIYKPRARALGSIIAAGVLGCLFYRYRQKVLATAAQKYAEAHITLNNVRENSPVSIEHLLSALLLVSHKGYHWARYGPNLPIEIFDLLQQLNSRALSSLYQEFPEKIVFAAVLCALSTGHLNRFLGNAQQGECNLTTVCGYPCIMRVTRTHENSYMLTVVEDSYTQRSWPEQIYSRLLQQGWRLRHRILYGSPHYLLCPELYFSSISAIQRALSQEIGKSIIYYYYQHMHTDDTAAQAEALQHLSLQLKTLSELKASYISFPDIYLKTLLGPSREG